MVAGDAGAGPFKPKPDKAQAKVAKFRAEKVELSSFGNPARLTAAGRLRSPAEAFALAGELS